MRASSSLAQRSSYTASTASSASSSSRLRTGKDEGAGERERESWARVGCVVRVERVTPSPHHLLELPCVALEAASGAVGDELGAALLFGEVSRR